MSNNTPPVVVEKALRQLAKQTRAAAAKFADVARNFTAWSLSIDPAMQACADLLQAPSNTSCLDISDALGDFRSMIMACNEWSARVASPLKSLESNIHVALRDTNPEFDVAALAGILEALTDMPPLLFVPSQSQAPSLAVLPRTSVGLTDAVSGIAVLFTRRSFVAEDLAKLLDDRAARTRRRTITVGAADIAALVQAGKKLPAFNPPELFRKEQ